MKTFPSSVINELISKIENLYVFPDTAFKVSEHLSLKLDEGAFDDLSKSDLAEELTKHLFKITEDKHLRVIYDTSDSVVLGDESITLDEEKLEEIRNESIDDNFGFYKVERLAGNIGYMDVRYFAPAEVAADTASAAMNFLGNTHALIIDLRNNRGGVPSMVDLICGYLFRPSVHIDSLYWRKGDQLEQHWSLPNVRGQHYGKKPVYVLTSSKTFSAGEELAYSLKQYRRATLVGEQTMGGAHPGRAIRFTDEFLVVMPMGRAIHPLTDTNWEGTGVEPDVSAPESDALTSAYSLALEEVKKNGSINDSLYKECELALNDISN